MFVIQLAWYYLMKVINHWFFLANLVSELDNQSTYYNNIAINWSEIGYRLYLETIIVV